MKSVNIILLGIYIINRMFVYTAIGAAIDRIIPIILLIINLRYLNFSISKATGFLFVVMLITLFSFSYYVKSSIELISFFSGLFLFYLAPYLFRKKSAQYRNEIYSIIINVLRVNILVVLIQFVMINGFESTLSFFWQTDFNTRPMGFFGEPSHFGSFCSLLVFMPSGFLKKHKSTVVFTLISLLMTASLISLIVMIFILLRYFENLGIKSKLCFITLTTLVSIPLVIFSPIKDRLINLSSLEDVSFVIRVVKGPLVALEMETDEQIIGFGNKNEQKNQEYTNRSNIINSQDYKESYSYYSGVFSELVYFGLIGFIILNLFYYSMLSQSGILAFTFFEVIRLGSSINYSSSIAFLYVILATIYLRRHN
ncbi:hypothetical protein LL295_21830 [Vibrio campbellii]|uniref:hypothetical protein n=1 Tax=Vibrio campbellii TaxID=680 RepID=UPI001D1790F1|nr:hypothetical protein [Vibrio campbellii]MCC4226131.1 hypothetical protein [Vibrio campbellii]